MQTTRKNVRSAFKAIGYSVSFNRNPLNVNLCNIAFKNSDMLRSIAVSSSGCYGSETYAKHKAAFELANSYIGDILSDTDQKVV